MLPAGLLGGDKRRQTARRAGRKDIR